MGLLDSLNEDYPSGSGDERRVNVGGSLEKENGFCFFHYDSDQVPTDVELACLHPSFSR